MSDGQGNRHPQRLLDSLDISAEDMERIHWRNAAELLGIKKEQA